MNKYKRGIFVKILLTGNRGLIGKYLEKQLLLEGHEVVGYDILHGEDICNQKCIIKAGNGCEVVVHLAALLGNDESESAEEITRTNLLGTFNVLESARINKVRKVIFMSSADSLGLFKGEGKPSYFPIDDMHPCIPTTPYAISKKLSEEMCKSFSKTNNIPTICLRPPGVWDEEIYGLIVEARRKKPEIEYYPFWEYGAFIDIRDLVSLIINCIKSDYKGYDCYLVTSDDIQSTGYTAMELVNKIYPEIEVKNKNKYILDPYASLIDCKRVKDEFAWKPLYTWKRYIKK